MDRTHYAIALEGQSFRLARTAGPVPGLGSRQVLIKVAAASLNYRDHLVRMNGQGSREGLIPLSDAAGTIEQVGAEVTSWKPGDRVSPNFFSAWVDGPFKPHHLASALGGGDTDGVLSSHVLADQDSVVAIPEHLSLQEASALPCAGVTAWHALFERGNLQSGETVLVQGTGGVAMLALQMAHAQGAKVIVTSSSDEKLQKARQLGAWQTINYRETPEWDQVAIDLTGGIGVDHILELGGTETYARSVNAVGYGGRIAQIGALTGFDAAPQITPMQFKNASINGICVGSAAQFARMNRFLEKHRIQPVIDRVVEFGDVERAYEALISGQHMGKIVIQVS